MKYVKPLMAVGFAMSTCTSAAPVPREGGRRAQAPLLMRREEAAEDDFASPSGLTRSAGGSQQRDTSLLRRSTDDSHVLTKRGWFNNFVELMNKTPKDPNAWKKKILFVTGLTGLSTWYMMDKKRKKDDEWYEYAGLKEPEKQPNANTRQNQGTNSQGRQYSQQQQQGQSYPPQGPYPQQGMPMNPPGTAPTYQQNTQMGQGMPMNPGTMPMSQGAGGGGNFARRSLDGSLTFGKDTGDVKSALFRRNDGKIVYYVPQGKPESVRVA